MYNYAYPYPIYTSQGTNNNDGTNGWWAIFIVIIIILTSFLRKIVTRFHYDKINYIK